MDQSNTIHSFVAVIGDIKDSRLLENRKEVQLRLQEVLERLNENSDHAGRRVSGAFVQRESSPGHDQ